MLTDGDPATGWRADGIDETARRGWCCTWASCGPCGRSAGRSGRRGSAGRWWSRRARTGSAGASWARSASAEPGAWQTLRLREVIEARQVRLRFVGGEGVSAVGGLAEVEVRGPGGKGDGDGGHGGGSRQAQGRRETRPGRRHPAGTRPAGAAAAGAPAAGGPSAGSGLTSGDQGAGRAARPGSSFGWRAWTRAFALGGRAGGADNRFRGDLNHP